jgi:hypothetical protein
MNQSADIAEALANDPTGFNPGCTVQFDFGRDPDPAAGEGYSRLVPAVVTRVGTLTVVNLRVQVDGPGGTLWVSSVRHASEVDDGEPCWSYPQHAMIERENALARDALLERLLAAGESAAPVSRVRGSQHGARRPSQWPRQAAREQARE